MKRVLIAGSAGLQSEALKLLVRRAGFQATAHATTRDETIEKIRECDFDIIIADTYLYGEPGGLDLAMRIRNATGLPIIFITAHRFTFSSGKSTLDNLTRSWEQRLEKTWFLQKPVQYRKLKSMLDQIAETCSEPA